MATELAKLRARIAALEERIAASAQPAFSPLGGLKIAPNGAVSYDFDGHIHARGLDLDTVVDDRVYWNLAPDGDHRVQWLREDRKPAALLAGGEYRPISSPTVTQANVLHIRAMDPEDPDAAPPDSSGGGPTIGAGFGKAGVTLVAGRDGGSGSSVSAHADAGSATVIDDTGASSFLKLAGLANRRVAFGMSNAYFNGSSISNPTTITHGLNAPTHCALVTGIDSGSYPIISAWGATASGLNQLVVRGKTADGGAIGPGDVGFYWLVITS